MVLLAAVVVVMVEQIQVWEEQHQYNLLIIILYIQDITVLQEDQHLMVEAVVDIQVQDLVLLL